MDDDGYDLLAVRIRRGTTINGAIVALCPAPDDRRYRHGRRVHRRPAGPVTRCYGTACGRRTLLFRRAPHTWTCWHRRHAVPRIHESLRTV